MATEGHVKDQDGDYGITAEQLSHMNTEKDMKALRDSGGSSGLAKLLLCDPEHGLDPKASGKASIQAHLDAFGHNKLPTPPAKSFFVLWFEAFKDPVILILCAAATLSTILGAAIPEEREENKWIEGVAIWVAVFLVTGVGALNDWQKDKQFRKLKVQSEIIEIKVIRGGLQLLVPSTDLCVGDVVVLDTGDKIVADGIVLESFGLVVDEASLTGESEPIKKNLEDDPWCRSGTAVSEGSGRLLLIAVGEQSEWGKTMALMSEAGDDQTPLQEKLTAVAALVGKIGASVAAACFVALLIKWCVVNQGFPLDKVNENGPVQFFLYCVTIIVVAIPEGLPLAVTMALAYSMKKMMRDQVFVRVLAACETMGGATAVCSDKTGTLTENRMTVTEGWFAGCRLLSTPTGDGLHPVVRRELENNFALNSKAFLIENDKVVDFVGNRTECALLMLMRNWGTDYKTVREKRNHDIVQIYGFSSAKKMASVLLKQGDSYRLYNKGAAEWVLRRCTHMLDEDANVVPLPESAREDLIHNVVEEMASRGLRCICLTYRDFAREDSSRDTDFFESADNVDYDLTAVAIVGIKDPVRKEVPDAVATCQHAGIRVRMVTGDNIFTAKHIARECGILTNGGEAMEGPVFRALDEEAREKVLPRLQVLARSSPEDKLTLVRALKKMGEVVAVTGDGTNDAPALKESDVGLAMGIAGTEVAKEAADTIILDDNFSSIVMAVLWGRNVFNSIRKFLQFQLTVNLVALVVAFFGALIGGHTPLNVLQLLWVNLIMDTMGALALATENPSPELLDEKPHGRQEHLITKRMYLHIAAQGMYQMFWMFLILYGWPVFFPAEYGYTTQCQWLGMDNNCADSFSGLTYDVNGTAVPITQEQIAMQCNWVLNCGYPCSNGPCTDNPYNQSAGVSPQEFMCGNSTNCQNYMVWDAGRSTQEKQFNTFSDEDFEDVGGVLFNAFILSQVSNLINCRRINDEYTVFGGLHKSPIFLVILGIIVTCQVIIMFFLGGFFHIQNISGVAWAYTIAIGIGALGWGFFAKFVSRCIFGPPQKGSDLVLRTVSANSRTLSGASKSSEVPRHAEVAKA